MGIHEKGIPDVSLHLRFMPLFLVENLVVSFNPNRPKSGPTEEVPNFSHLPKLEWNSFTEDALLPIEAIKVAGSNSTKLMHNVSSPSPCPPSLNTIPKLVFYRFTSVRKAKDTLLGDASRRNSGSPLVNRHRLMPNRPNEGGLLAATKRVPHLRPKEAVVTGEVPLPFITRPSDVGSPTRDGFPAGLGGVVKEVAPIGPPPSIRVPTKRSHFTIEKCNRFFHSFPSGASIGVNDFDFMVGSMHSTTRVLPLSKAS